MAGLVFGWVGLAQASAALDYQVVYNGLFSAGADLPIADLRLDARVWPDHGGLQETRIEVSSAAYPLVERLHPIRYRFRNWVSVSQPQQMLGFETYQRTRKLRHRLYLRDDSVLGVSRYDLVAGEGHNEIAQLDAGNPPQAVAVSGRLLDRLGLLQCIRRQPLDEQAEYKVEVTNGRERLRYSVRVVAAEHLTLAGVEVPAWKLRFDGLEADTRGRWRAAHRPLYVWLGQGPGRVPLRVDARHSIGLFRIQLKKSALVD